MRQNKIFVINGPNLNLLGNREPDIYGSDTLSDINKMIKQHSRTCDAKVCFFQSNHEGKIIDKIQSISSKKYSGLIINPGAYTHYSYAIRDAIKAKNIMTIEVHLSDIDEREEFRKISVLKDVCFAQIKGLGAKGYIVAFDMILKKML